MIKHVVFVKVKPGTPQEQIDAMVAGYDSMKDAIPELVSWSMGPDLRGDGDFTHAMVAVKTHATSLAEACAQHFSNDVAKLSISSLLVISVAATSRLFP